MYDICILSLNVAMATLLLELDLRGFSLGLNALTLCACNTNLAELIKLFTWEKFQGL